MAARSFAQWIVRICPECRRGAMRQVAGGLGKMGRCSKCGYTGPIRIEQGDDTTSIATG